LLNIGILASTKATDMQAVIDAIQKGQLDVRISVVISDKKDAYALQRAKNHGIKAVFIDSIGKDRGEFDKKASEILDKRGADFVFLIGYMRILGPWFVRKYKNKIVNIHPSLLPAFKGITDKDIYREVLESGIQRTGCTLHFVDESVDGGPIIMQKEVEVDKNDTADTLKERVQKAEQESIVLAISLFDKGKIKVENNKVKILEQEW
jgi:phosphoribosylglycinamide formyltransferase 1